MNRSRAGYLFLVGGICLAAVLARLISINQPFIDPWSWRQSDMAAIARNYWEGGFHFAYPQIDWSGSAAGYVGSEFPILPFLAAICYSVAGVHEWIGRLESVLFFALSLPFFVALVADTFGRTASIWALIFYAFAPLTMMTSRCFMPDMPSLSLSIVGLYCFRRWLQAGDWKSFLAGALTISVALLIKLPSALIGVPLGYLVLEHYGWTGFRRSSLWLFALIALLPAVAWYWHAWQIARNFYPHHFFGAGGVQLMSMDWYWDIAKRVVNRGLTAVPAALGLVGLIMARKSTHSRFFEWWLGGMILFVVVVGYGNRHPWYQLPLVPIVAAFAGYAVVRLREILRLRGVTSILISAVLIGCFGVQAYSIARYLYRPASADLRNLGQALKSQTPRNSLVVVADYGDPTALYYGERKGWHFTEKDGIYNGHPTVSADAIADLEKLRQQGATHIAFYAHSAWWLDYYPELAGHLRQTATPVIVGPAYQIFELRR